MHFQPESMLSLGCWYVYAVFCAPLHNTLTHTIHCTLVLSLNRPVSTLLSSVQMECIVCGCVQMPRIQETKPKLSLPISVCATVHSIHPYHTYERIENELEMCTMRWLRAGRIKGQKKCEKVNRNGIQVSKPWWQ